jgi:signal transduction histidine kinase
MALGLRQPHPDLLPFNTGFTLIILGEAMHLHALELHLGREKGPGQWLTLALAGALIKELVYRAAPDAQAHYLVGYAMLTVVFLAIGLKARAIALAEDLTSARWLSRSGMLGALAFGLRTLTGLAGWSEAEAINDQLSGVLTTLVVVAVALLHNFSMVGIYLERSHKRNSRLLVEEERARASAELTTQVAHLDRQRGMGELAAGLAHELGQPITSILMNASTLQQTLKQGAATEPQTLEITQDLIDQAGRARRILEGIRNFIKPHLNEMTRLHLPEVIAGAQAMLSHALRGQSVVVRMQCESSSPWVHGDVVQLSQVFLNLLRNALEARRPDTGLKIDIRLNDVGDFVQVQIEDNGHGLSDEELARCASPFFTTKSDGLGVGLPISRRILEHHGGSLSLARSASGQGALATLRLPRGNGAR